MQSWEQLRLGLIDTSLEMKSYDSLQGVSKALAEEDVVAAQVYMFNLDNYRAQEKAKADTARVMREQKERIDKIVTDRYKDMETAVPGLFDRNSTMNVDMTKFAIENGMDPDYIKILTRPETRLLDDKGNTIILGNGAVGLVKLLASAMNIAKATKAPALLEKLKAEGAKEVLRKLKNTDPSKQHRSLGDIPPGGGSTAPIGGVSEKMTEDQFAALSSADQERVLRGEIGA